MTQEEVKRIVQIMFLADNREFLLHEFIESFPQWTDYIKLLYMAEYGEEL